MKKYVRSDEVSDIKDPRERYFARKKRVRERRAQEAEGAKDAVLEAIRGEGTADERLTKLFELLVPSSGEAETKAGELVRAMMKIMYRDYNDGDLFYEGYGIETCGSPVHFLCEKVPELYDQFDTVAGAQLEGTRYTNKLADIADDLMAHIEENIIELMGKNDEDMFDYEGEDWIRDQGWESLYDYECEYPENVQFHIDEEDISYQDVEWEIESWDYVRNYEVNADRFGITVYDVKKEDYDELEGSMYSWLEQWGDDLDSEYGSEEDREDEDEEEEDDEYEEDEEE